MKLSKKLIDAINSQINAEQWSAQLYLSMALEAADRSLDGTAVWMNGQAAEEMAHAKAMIAYLQSRGVRPELQAIKEVPAKFDGALKMFELSLKHEQQVTDMIHKIVALAIEEKDYGCESFFRTFVTEQEEEETTVENIIDRFRMAGEVGLIFVDHSLASRQ